MAFAWPLALVLPFAGCSRGAADPLAAGVDIAQARCECTRQNAPNVARCVNHASRRLYDATTAIDDGAAKTALVRAYEDTFRTCPWDDPSYYR